MAQYQTGDKPLFKLMMTQFSQVYMWHPIGGDEFINSQLMEIKLWVIYIL